MKGPRTRTAIVTTAAEAFTSSGYEVTTLQDIAHRLGISQSAVLFHFESKRALLMAIVEPLFADLEALISRFERYPTPLTPARRRQLLTAYCDLLISHRPAAILLVRDLTTIIQMHWPATGPEVAHRMMALLHGPDPTATSNCVPPRPSAASCEAYACHRSTPPNSTTQPAT